MSISKTFHGIAIEATRRCNLNCRFCDSAVEDDQILKKLVEMELTTDEIKSILRQARELDIYGVTWLGGEFLVREDAFELLEYAYNLGFFSLIITNATMLSRDYLKKIKYMTKSKIFFGFSINSLDYDENIWSRDDSPVTVLQAMKNCDDLKIGYVVLITIGKFNLSSLEKTITFFQDRNVLVVRSQLVPRGKGKPYFQKHALSKEDMKNIVHPILRQNSVTYMEHTPSFVSPEYYREEKPYLGIIKPGCWITQNIAISPEGDVGLCPHMTDNLKFGNIREKLLVEIINSENYLKYTNMENLKGKCGRCRYKYSCGGCRDMAYYHTGDYFAEDPLCFFDPQDENQKSEYEETCTQKYKEFLDLPSNMHLFIASILLEQSFEYIPTYLRKNIINILKFVGVKWLRKLSKLRPELTKQLITGKTRKEVNI